MRPSPLLVLAASTLVSSLIPSLAHAGRFSVGVSLGRTQAEADAKADYDASGTAGIWVRAALGHRFSADLQFGKVSSEDERARIRSIDLTGRVTIANLRHGLRPIALLTLGGDSNAEGSTYHHTELGLGLEYDLAADFVLGGDLRVGERTIDSQVVYDVQPAARLPPDLTDGGYRAVRLYLGVRL